MKSNKNVRRLAEPGSGIYLAFLLAFAVAAVVLKQYYLAAAEGSVFLVLLIYALVHLLACMAGIALASRLALAKSPMALLQAKE